MGFYHFILNYLKSSSIPVFKSFFNAYKHTTAGAKEEAGGTLLLTQPRSTPSMTSSNPCSPKPTLPLLQSTSPPPS